MDIHLNIVGRTDVTAQIYRQLREAILDGRLNGGEALPSTRELAERLSVSRNSVVSAYERLAGEGFVRTQVGAGTFVRSGLARDRASVGDRSALRPRALWGRLPEGPTLALSVGPFDFRPGLPDVSQFPFAAFRARLSAAFRARDGETAGHIEAAGDASLRAAISRYVAVSRGVLSTADDVVITSGSQQALDLIVRVMVEPGEVVAVEDPGYPPARRAFTVHGCRVVGVPVDDQGICVSDLPVDARAVYVTPSHQYPLGIAMSLERRQELLRWACTHGAAVIEDDYDSEFRFGGRPLEPLHAFDDEGVVLYVGSLSKTLLPTLRIGFVVVPEGIRSAFRKAKHAADWHTSVPLQYAAFRFLEDGLLAEHVRRMRRMYEARHAAVLDGLHREFGGILSPIVSHCGLHVSAFFVDETVNDGDVVARAAALGVHCFPLSRHYGSECPKPGLLLGYGAIHVDDIAEGLRRIASAIC